MGGAVNRPPNDARRVLLVNPHWRSLRSQGQGQYRRAWPPLDLALMAQMLQDDGFDVRLLDNNAERLPLAEIARMASDFDRIFVTSSPYDRWQCPALDITFFYDTVACLPRERLVIMGAHVSERLETSLMQSRASAAVIHEPETTVLDICRHGIYEGQRGVAFLRDGTLQRGPEPEPLDLERAPFPAFDQLPMSRYYYELMGRRFAILEASRGCPYRCTFCYLGMYGKRFRQKSVERFCEEVNWTVKRHDCRNLYFMDLEFALNRKFVSAFCESMLRRGVDVRWCCQTRVTDVDDELVALMKRAGCRLIHFGVESGAERILKSTGKKISIDDAVRAVDITRRHGVASAVFMNVGFPGETREERRATRAFALKLNPTYASFHIVMPYPGTPLASTLPSPDLPAHEYPCTTATSHEEFAALKRELRLCYASFYLRPTFLRRLWQESGPSLMWQQARALSDLVFQ
jgi:radical SAM superfamily enzyme YgiQ (UPF0313 family)